MKCPIQINIFKRIKIKTKTIAKNTSGVLYFVEVKVEMVFLVIGYGNEVVIRRRKQTTEILKVRVILTI